jgi:methionyl aminopeptidase
MDNFQSYRKAGKIAAEALEYGRQLIKPGAKLLEVCDKVEEKILALGGNMAFPVQISCDDIAAHYCPDEEDAVVFDRQVTSLDVGVHVNGFIGDNAVTVDLSGQYADLVKASREALEAAIKVIKPGVTLGAVGKEIHDAITSYGFAPIRNLSGHALGEYNVHDKPSIPNFDTGDDTQLKEGQVIAIEPFASTGAGVIYESGNAIVFSLSGRKPVRSQFTKEVLMEIGKFEELPFTTRWLTRKLGKAKVAFGFRELKQLGLLVDYPPLVDRKHGMVSQAEHTVLVKDKAEILTRL